MIFSEQIERENIRVQTMEGRKYYDPAVPCVKDTVLPMQIKLYDFSHGDFDKIYGEARIMESCQARMSVLNLCRNCRISIRR